MTEYLSLRKAASRLGLHHATLSRAVKRGDITPEIVTPGGFMRFSKAEVERYRLQCLKSKQNKEQHGAHEFGDTERVAWSRIDSLLESIPEMARNLVSAQYAAMAVMDDQGNVVRFVTAGISDEQREAIGALPSGIGLLGLIYHQGVSIRTDDISRHPNSAGFPPNHPHMESFLGVPIILNRENLGNLYLTNKIGAPRFSEHDQSVVEMIAQCAASAVENARLYIRESQLRKHSEFERARLQAILESSPSGIVVADAENGDIVLANGEAARILGLALNPGEGRNRYERAAVFRARDGTPYDVEDLPLQRALRNGETSKSVEVVFHLPDGRFIPTTVNAAPIFDDDGNVTAAIAVIEDITALQEVENTKAEFLSMITHDLRGPLATIKGLSSGILMDSAPKDMETVVEYLTSIDEEADRMNELVGNLLDMSRIEANSMAMDPEICHLADITTETVHRLERSRVGGRHKINIDVPLELPEIYADYNQISRVLTNLLSNAIKYSPEGCEIDVKSYMNANQSGEIVTQVRDRGIGIPENEIDKIFDKFYRVTSQRGRGRPGSGLGLAICKAIIQAHDGKIWVESSQGKGSTFTFTLPAATVSVGYD